MSGRPVSPVHGAKKLLSFLRPALRMQEDNNLCRYFEVPAKFFTTFAIALRLEAIALRWRHHS